MAKYNIKLFAHGVPKGQDVWGNPGADAKYIEAFYGRQTNVASQMFVEVMQFGAETNTYYTYFRYGNFQEVGGRTGGYFALTLRINYYYSDIQNIYNLLEAAYNKYIVGTIIDQSQNGCRFLVPQLEQANDSLKALETEIVHYLMQFSSDTDFISLNGFKCNGQEDFSIINLLEASTTVVCNHVKSKGKISVSSLHPTAKEQQIVNQKNAEVQAINANAQQQITATQQKAKNDIASAQKQATLDIQAAQKDKEESIKAIKDQYKDIDIKLTETQNKLSIANNEINKKESMLHQNEKIITDNKTRIKQLEDREKELRRYSDLNENLKSVQTSINKFFSDSPCSAETENGYDKGGRGKAAFNKLSKSILPWATLIISLFSLCCVVIVLILSNRQTGTIENLRNELAPNQQVNQLFSDSLATNSVVKDTVSSTND